MIVTTVTTSTTSTMSRERCEPPQRSRPNSRLRQGSDKKTNKLAISTYSEGIIIPKLGIHGSRDKFASGPVAVPAVTGRKPQLAASEIVVKQFPSFDARFARLAGATSTAPVRPPHESGRTGTQPRAVPSRMRRLIETVDDGRFLVVPSARMKGEDDDPPPAVLRFAADGKDSPERHPLQ